MAISGYMSRLPQPPQERELKRVVEALHGVRPDLYSSFPPQPCVRFVGLWALYGPLLAYGPWALNAQSLLLSPPLWHQVVGAPTCIIHPLLL